MQEVVFKEKKTNHFYAKKDEEGNLVEVKNPQKGDKVIEFAVIKGGAV